MKEPGDVVRLKQGYRDRRMLGIVADVNRDESGTEMIRVVECPEPGLWQSDWWETVGRITVAEMRKL